MAQFPHLPDKGITERGELLPLDDLVHVGHTAGLQPVHGVAEEPVRDLGEVHDYTVCHGKVVNQFGGITRHRDHLLNVVLLGVQTCEVLRLGVQVYGVDHLGVCESADDGTEGCDTCEHVYDDLPVPHE